MDGHDRGVKVIARALRDAGMEVIYTGLRQTPEMIVNASLQEDVDVIGLSILSGAHNSIVPRVMELLKQNEMSDVLVLVGGIIPDQDVASLKQSGVAAVFQPGTPMEDIVRFIRQNLRARGVGSVTKGRTMADRTKIEAAINVLPTKVQSSHPRFEKNMREMARLVAEVRNQEQQIAEGGGAKAIETQHNEEALDGARAHRAAHRPRNASCSRWALTPPGRCTTSGAERRRPASSPASDASMTACSC